MTLNNRGKIYLGKLGYVVATTEHWNAFAKKRNDLFGMFDLLAIHTGDQTIVGVQITSKSNISSRIKKLRCNPVYLDWLKCRGSVLVLVWYKVKNRFVSEETWLVD